MSNDDLIVTYGLLVQQHIFVIRHHSRDSYGIYRELPQRLLAAADVVVNLDTDEVIKCRFDDEDASMIARVINLYGDNVSNIVDIQEFLNYSLWP